MRYALQIFAAASLFALGGCDSSTSPASSSDATATPVKLHKIGEAAPAEGLTVTLTSVKQTSSPVPGITPAGPDETYLVAKYTLKNTGKSGIDLTSRPGVELHDAAGSTYALDDVSTTVVAIMGDSTGASSTMNPGTSAKTAAVWKVAKKGLDPATWKIVVRTTPALEFALK